MTQAKRERILIAGATGSIGQSSLSVLESNPEKFEIWGLAAGSNAKALYQLCAQYQPQHAVLADPAACKEFKKISKSQGQWAGVFHEGASALCSLAGSEELDVHIAAITGGAGLYSTLAAVQAGKRVLLANKEALVMAGSLMTDAARKSKALLLPVDSEHNAIFQAMPLAFHQDFLANHLAGLSEYAISKLLLTGSGGPFRTKDRASLRTVSPSEAIAHPNWEMGAKISVDSATMANKGLELIEAMYLFNCAADEIDIIIHPQSIVHSMVQYQDGSVVAQMGEPDMRTPIAHCLAYPARMISPVKPLDLIAQGALEFEAPDYKQFPMLKLAEQVARQGQSAMIIYNAANEIAVDMFLRQKLPFLAIDRLVNEVLDRSEFLHPKTLQEVLDIDANARELAGELGLGIV